MDGLIFTLCEALALEAVLFFAVWVLAVRIRNYALLDVAFSYGILPLIALYALSGSARGGSL